MSSDRRPRFKRASAVPIQVTTRDREIIRQIHCHRFLRSSHIVALIGGSEQQILRRMQLLYHHGFLERPRSQLRYYERGASREIVYGLANKGGELLRRELGIAIGSFAWSEKNHTIGRVYLDHALLVSDIMVTIELACRKYGKVRLLHQGDLGLQLKQGRLQWQGTMRNGKKFGPTPDRLFAVEYQDENGQSKRVHYFLEADRGTMPVTRKNQSQTSFQRKLQAYHAAWVQDLHRTQLGFHRFRVLTVTTISKRVHSLVEACSQLESGYGLFLFADKSILLEDILSAEWQGGKPDTVARMMDSNGS